MGHTRVLVDMTTGTKRVNLITVTKKRSPPFYPCSISKQKISDSHQITPEVVPRLILFLTIRKVQTQMAKWKELNNLL